MDHSLFTLADRLLVHTLGEVGGQAAHTVTVSEMPSHSHMVVGTTATATTRLVGPTVGLAASTGSAAYSPPGSPVAMAANALGSAGSSQPHENRQPFLTLSFCIALQGIFPSQS